VAQESLQNVVKHALARQITVCLLQNNDRLILEIADDGQGFELNAVDTAHHFGIKGMQERVEMIGGILEIESQPGRGTTVRLTVQK
jgi:signal transduction histidine kinase